MLQKIIESEKIQDIEIHALENGSLISAFEVDLLDEEILGPNGCESFLRGLLSDIPANRTLRIYLNAEYSRDEKISHSRQLAIQDMGFIKYKAVVVLEKTPSFDLSFLRKKKTNNPDSLVFDFKPLSGSGLYSKSMSKNDLESFFPEIGDEIEHRFQTLDFGSKCFSVLRLVKQSEFGLDLETLSHIKDAVPVPFTICCAIQPVPQMTAETLLRRRSSQNSQGEDIKESRKYSEAQTDLEAISLDGNKLFKFEWTCLVGASDEKELRTIREDAKRKLQALGEIYVESVGALESLKSFFPGTAPHFTLLEKDDVMVSYMPLISRGDSQSKQRVDVKSLATHC